MVVQCAVRDVVDIHIIPHLDLSVKRERGRVAPALQPCPPLAHAPFAFLYNLSERQTEQMVHENIPMKFFVGVAVDKNAPDHSTLTAFQARLKANGGRRPWRSCCRRSSRSHARSRALPTRKAGTNPPLGEEQPP
ncbi:MAG: transposase [Anaerolineae bacterium]